MESGMEMDFLAPCTASETKAPLTSAIKCVFVFPFIISPPLPPASCTPSAQQSTREEFMALFSSPEY